MQSTQKRSYSATDICKKNLYLFIGDWRHHSENIINRGELENWEKNRIHILIRLWIDYLSFQCYKRTVSLSLEKLVKQSGTSSQKCCQE